MTAENTLLDRCVVAYSEAFESAITSDAVVPNSRRAGVAAVLDHLAGEIVVLHQQEPRLTVHELARLLICETGSVEPEIEEPPETWDSHPSLTAAERNPSLR